VLRGDAELLAALTGERHAARQPAHCAEETDGGDGPRKIIQHRHARGHAALDHVGLRLDRFTHVIAGPARGEFRQSRAHHARQDERPVLRDDLVDLPLQAARVLLEDAGPVVGGEQAQAEGAALAMVLGIAAREDEQCPREAAVAGELLGPQQQLCPAVRGPCEHARRVLGAVGLPERNANERDDGDGQNQQRPLAYGLQGGAGGHDTSMKVDRRAVDPDYHTSELLP